MDKSDLYVRMCKCAHEIQYRKCQDGFEEGDFLYADNNVRVVGHDYLNLGNYINKQTGCFRFAVMESITDEGHEIDNSNLPYETKHASGKYYTDVISNPIWLPRLDQLIDTYFIKSFGLCVDDFVEFMKLRRRAYYNCEMSMEAHTLSIIMYNIFYKKYYESRSGDELYGEWYSYNRYNKKGEYKQ